MSAADLEPIVVAHLDAWNAPAGPGRVAAIATTYAAGVIIGEPHALLRGHDGMESAIAALQQMAPGASIFRTGGLEIAQDLVTYTWSLGPDADTVLASGRDVLIIRDGLITSLYVLLD